MLFDRPVANNESLHPFQPEKNTASLCILGGAKAFIIPATLRNPSPKRKTSWATG